MIRQQNKIKLGLALLFGILEIAALIGAYVTNYYTRTRMGMLRHVVYLNGKWERGLPLVFLKWIAVFLICSLLILSIIKLFKRDVRFTDRIFLSLSTTLGLWTLYYILFRSTVTNKAYYIISLCLVLGTIFQNVLWKINSLKK